MSVVAETNATFVHVPPPTLTVAPLTKAVPVIVRFVPPAIEPVKGYIEVMVAPGTEVKKLGGTVSQVEPLSGE